MTSFEPGVAAWLSSLGSVRDRVRQELVSRQLAAHLPAAPSRVLDVGCGQGTQALRLAATGHDVLGVDVSAELLGAARDAAARLAGARGRLRFEKAELFDFAAACDERFDVVCCHGVVMYLPSLRDAITALVGLALPGGVLSVLSRNQAGVAMRAGLAGRWAEAREAFDAETYTNNLGLSRVRADRPESVRGAFEAAGADVVDWYGVRLFSDQLGQDSLLPDAAMTAVITAEEEAGRRDPFRQVAALTHTVARRR